MSAPKPNRDMPATSPINDPRVRGVVYQVLLVGVLGFLLWEAADNAITNMRARGIPTNFDFWTRTSGFDINQTLISYSAVSTYGDAFWVGLLNTLLVAGIGVVFATIVGFVVGIARLSQNWIIAKLATIYVETIRNVPLLLQLLFWYNAVLKPLPAPRQSLVMPGFALQMPGVSAVLCLALAVLGWWIARIGRSSSNTIVAAVAPVVGPLLMGLGALGFIAGPGVLFEGGGAGLIALAGSSGIFLNNRGLILPEPVFGPGSGIVLLAFVLGVAAAAIYLLWARARQRRTGQLQPLLVVTAALVILPPVLAYFAAGQPVTLAFGTLRGFNFQGGVRVLPEIVALLLGLVLYTAAFIAETVRAGIQSVARGQSEAAQALGLRSGPTLRLIVVPQALRVVIPPLTNQYLNLTKNSSLAVFVGYPDLVQVFAGTVLNQTGAAVQVITITMAVYLAISLVTSLLMGLYNRRMALRER